MILRTALLPLLTFSILIASACTIAPAKDPLADLIAPIPQYGAAPLARVKLSVPSGKESVTLDAGKAVVRIDGKKHDVSGPLTLRRGAGAVITGDFGKGAMVEIAPAESPEHFSIDGRTYRGLLRVYAMATSWEIVNIVDLEEYVAGVVGWEMITSWPVEALKAQAVASRTYAIFTIEQNRGRGSNWDLDDTTQYQVYGGVGPTDAAKQWRESANVLAARSQTTGQVLTYQGKGFKAFFHSTSGGHTTDPRVGLGIDASIEPLSGVDLGEFDKDSPKANWEIRIAGAELNARLLENRIKPGSPIRIEPDQSAPSGHVVTLRLYGPAGHPGTVSAIDFRRAAGLPSTNFTTKRDGSAWVFKGHGYGHGCGMCQWSARGMALKGWDAQRILKTMYPGSDLKTLY